MMIIHKSYYLLILSMLLASCDRPSFPKIAPEYLYEVKGQHLIGSSINDNHATISLLYGNKLAQIAASESSLKILSGARYTLVTWEQKQMPSWYGTNMNGEIFAVESLEIFSSKGGHRNISYQLKKGKSPIAAPDLGIPEDRIKLILGQKLAVMP